MITVYNLEELKEILLVVMIIGTVIFMSAVTSNLIADTILTYRKIHKLRDK